MRADGFEPEGDPQVRSLRRKRGGSAPRSPLPPRPGPALGRAEKLSFFLFNFFFLSFPPLPLDVSLMPAARRAADSCGT